MSITVIIVFGLYALSLMVLIYGFQKLTLFSIKNSSPKTRFSIVIPFRNEAKNLPTLLESLSELNYPSKLFEVFLINDASEDSSEEIVLKAIVESEITLRLFQNKRTSSSPKKDALDVGIKNAQFEWIVTTDADCEVPTNWLTTLDVFIQKKKPAMVCGPVLYNSDDGFIENFQEWDGFSLQTVTQGSFGLGKPLMANGANLTFQKEAFQKVKGFEGNNHLASGDDIFLMEKMKRAFPKKVLFLKSKEAIVTTKPQSSWQNLIQQRIRWASKTSKQKNLFSMILGLLVTLTNFFVLAIPFLIYFDSKNAVFYVSALLIKMGVDYLAIRQSANFFNKKTSVLIFLTAFFTYAFLLIIIILGSLRGNFSWKGREFKNQR